MNNEKEKTNQNKIQFFTTVIQFQFEFYALIEIFKFKISYKAQGRIHRMNTPMSHPYTIEKAQIFQIFFFKQHNKNR